LALNFRVFLSEHARHDLRRLTDFASEQDPAFGEEVALTILDGLALLERHPFVGRAGRRLSEAGKKAGLRELVISHGRTGYLALYRLWVAQTGAVQKVVVLAIRHQRELDYHPFDEQA
jgi:plasmid stabilization system protein ParE